MIGNVVTSNAAFIPNLYYMGAIFFGLVVAVRTILRGLDKRIDRFASPIVEEQKRQNEQLAATQQDLETVKGHVSDVRTTVAEHKGILSGLRNETTYHDGLRRLS